MAKKGRSARGYHERRVDFRAVRQRFLIVCEGKKTEPAYFESFRAPGVVLKVEGGDSDPVRLVETAADRWKQAKRDYDQVWCVFDRDDVPTERINRALELARQGEIHIAYSNQAFELWFLLHYQECTGPLTRRDYIVRLNGFLERPYKKNDPKIYGVLEPYLEKAIERAMRLMEQHEAGYLTDDDPSTTVHLLVQELKRFSQP